MYLVYWSTFEDGAPLAHAREFDSSDMAAALAFMEALRGKQRSGENIRFVTMCSENPGSVGHPGAADPAPNYAWKKRRR